MRLVIAAVLLCAGCRFDADFADTAYACPTGTCPSGFECIEGRCQVEGAVPDASNESGDADSDGAGADAATCVCDTSSRADSCTGVEMLSDPSVPGGQLVCASTEMNTNELFGCTGAPMPAADAVYRFAATAGQTIDATLRPTGFDGALYLLASCTQSCIELADDVGLGGTEQLTSVAAATADYYIVVDSGTGTGCYELHVSVTD